MVNRGEHPVIVFDKEGRLFLDAWGEGIFASPHGKDRIHLADDGDHSVRVFDRSGNLLQMLGEPHRAAVAQDAGNGQARAGSR